MNDKNAFSAELLAPAGSFDSAVAAVNAGADAIYMGGRRFSARAFSESAKSEEDMLLRALRHCHLFGVRLYMTLNILFKDTELLELYSYLLPYYEAGVDGLIIQDLGVASLVSRLFPGLPLYASTQMTITSLDGVRLLSRLGIRRVILSRELGLDEIRLIRDGLLEEGLDVELEAFIHGAMCYSYSGACFFSSFLGGRSGNRGRCAGPCRLPYSVELPEIRKERIRQTDRKQPVKGQKAFYLSMKDMCTIDMLPALLEAGIRSLKIEGRMKPPVYTAGVVSVYRKYLDMLRKDPEGYRVSEEDKRILAELYDRGGTTHYLSRHNGRGMIALAEKAFRVPDEKVISDIREKYIEKNKKLALDAELLLKKGQRAILRVYGQGKVRPVLAEVVSDQPIEAAEKLPTTREEIERGLLRTGGTVFEFASVSITMDEGLFVPASLLKRLRREALKACEKNYTRDGVSLGRSSDQPKPVAINTVPIPMDMVEIPPYPEPERRVSVESEGQLSAALLDRKTALIYLDEACFTEDMLGKKIKEIHEAGKKAGLRLRRISRSDDKGPDWRDLLTDKSPFQGAARPDAVLIRTLDELGQLWNIAGQEPFLNGSSGNLKESMSPELVFDYTVYAFNRESALLLRRLGARSLTFPVELTRRELMNLRRSLDSERREGRTVFPCIDSRFELDSDRDQAEAFPGDPDGGKEALFWELPVYGRFPMMVSANCVLKSCGRCGHGNDTAFLIDRMGKRMPVKTYCRYCYNQIYNADPYCVYDLPEEIKGLSPDSVRYDFSSETKEEARRILSGCLPETFTRGHFRHGVE